MTAGSDRHGPLLDGPLAASRRWEAFYSDGAQVGALYREIGSEQILTRIAFAIGGGEYFRAESRVALAEGTWTRSHYRQQPGGVDAQLARAAAGFDAGSLPGYAEYLLVRQVAADPDRVIRFGKVADSATAAVAAATTIRAEELTTLHPPGGDAVPARTVTVRGTVLDSTHWIADGEVLGSDWNGATSYVVVGETAALTGADEPVRAFITGGFEAG